MNNSFVLLLILVLAACAIQPANPQPTYTPYPTYTRYPTNPPMNKAIETQTETILAHHVKAIKDCNLEAVLSDFTEDSTLIFPEGVFHGLISIRAAFAARLVGVTPKEAANIKVVHQDVAGEVVYIIFERAPSGPVATETYVMHDGKILVETLFDPQ